jgi:hypothetical protein
MLQTWQALILLTVYDNSYVPQVFMKLQLFYNISVLKFKLLYDLHFYRHKIFSQIYFLLKCS